MYRPSLTRERKKVIRNTLDKEVVVDAVVCTTCRDLIYGRAPDDSRWCSCGRVLVRGFGEHMTHTVRIGCSVKIVRGYKVGGTAREVALDFRRKSGRFGIRKLWLP
jgi:hypothetical protein